MNTKIKYGVLAGLVAVLVWVNVGREDAPTAAARVELPARASSSGAASRTALNIPDAVLHVERLEAKPRVRVGDIGRNIFEYVARRPAARRPPASVQVPVAAPVPVRPPPPQAPVRFFGFAEGSRQSERRVFLTDGESIFVVGQGEIFLRRYRLVRVQRQSVEVEEIDGSHRWVVPLEQP